MAIADLEAKEKAAEAARAKAEQAKADLDQAIAEADQEVKEKAAVAARAAADQAKGGPDQDAKEQAAAAARASADQAKTAAELAKAKAKEAKDKADQAEAEAVRFLRLQGLQPQGTPPPGLPISNFQTLVQNAEKLEKLTGLFTKVLLAIIVAFFLGMIIYNFRDEGTLLIRLSDPKVTRGFITFLIALGTIAIAVMLVIAAFSSDGGNGNATIKERDESLKERFTMGKEVLTALIGILGTIVGFYFGSAVLSEVQVLKVDDVKVVGEPKPSGTIKLSFQVIGGKAPYSYTVTFPAPTTIATLKGESTDGKVSAEITIPAKIPANTELTPIKIEVTDSDKKTAAQEIKEPKILIKAQDGQGLKVADAKVEGEPKADGKIKLSFQVTGGKAPYSYAVTFPPPTTIAPLKGETGDGKVSAEITIPAKIPTNIELTPIKIQVTDSDKKTTAQEIKEPKNPIKAKDGAPPET